MSWPGLVPIAKRILYGAPRAPKWKHYGISDTPTTSESYEGMHKYYRWFRQDDMVRRCELVNAIFSTMSAGFETELEATREGVDVEDYTYLKEKMDNLNRQVHLDEVLFVTQLKRSIYGKAGWEVVMNDKELPEWLLSLRSDKLKPNLTDAWELTGFAYEGRDGFYKPEEILYFTNLQLEADQEGLSDIEPIVDICKARHDLLRLDFPEIVRTLWAPYVLLEVDTSGMDPTKEEAFLTALAAAARAGKSLAVNKSIKATVVDIKVDLSGLNSMLDKFEQAILANFGTPKFLLGKPIENRATAYAEIEAYVDGPIAHIQRDLKRKIEANWYDRWALKFYEDEGTRFEEGGVPPVLVKHKWRMIRTSDVYEMAKAVAVLYGRGEGIIADHPDLAFDMMGWPLEKLEEPIE